MLRGILLQGKSFHFRPQKNSPATSVTRARKTWTLQPFFFLFRQLKRMLFSDICVTACLSLSVSVCVRVCVCVVCADFIDCLPPRVAGKCHTLQHISFLPKSSTKRTCIHTRIYVCICIYIYVHIYVYTHTHTRLKHSCQWESHTPTHFFLLEKLYETYLHIHTCIYMCRCIYVYMYTYIYIHTRNIFAGESHTLQHISFLPKSATNPTCMYLHIFKYTYI